MVRLRCNVVVLVLAVAVQCGSVVVFVVSVFLLRPCRELCLGHSIVCCLLSVAHLSNPHQKTIQTADKFEMEFPQGASPEQKGRLLGSVFFLNMNFFEAQKEQEGGMGM